jgi:hypothetical protein
VTLRDQIGRIDSSKIAQTVAKSFLIGFGVAIMPMLLPALHDFGSFMNELLAQLWWYRFFSCGMTGGLSFAVGQYMKSPFDKTSSSTPTTLQLPPKL